MDKWFLLDPSKVLLVDDDPDFLDRLKEIIVGGNPDLTIQEVRDGHSAVRAWEHGHHGVVFLDMMLPKRSGFLVLEKLRLYPEVRPFVVMVTANEGLRHRRYAEALGVDGYAFKPISADRILGFLSGGLEEVEKRNREA